MSEPSTRAPDLSPQQKRALLSQLLRHQARQTVSELPLSYGQQALWLTHQLAPKSWRRRRCTRHSRPCWRVIRFSARRIPHAIANPSKRSMHTCQSPSRSLMLPPGASWRSMTASSKRRVSRLTWSMGQCCVCICSRTRQRTTFSCLWSITLPSMPFRSGYSWRNSGYCIRRRRPVSGLFFRRSICSIRTMDDGRQRCWWDLKVSICGHTGSSNWLESCQRCPCQPIGHGRRCRRTKALRTPFDVMQN